MTGSPCTFSPCGGAVEDGYCNLCGRAPTPAAATATPGPAGRPAPPGQAPTSTAWVDPGAASGTAPGRDLRPPPPGGAAPGSPGRPPPPGAGTPGTSGAPGTGASGVDGARGSAPQSAPTYALPRVGAPTRVPTLRPTSLRTRSLRGRRDSQRTDSGRSSRRTGSTRLGLGLVDLPPIPTGDPATAIMAVPEVPEGKRFCSSCDKPVGRSRDEQPGRTEGFCPHCRSHYSFTPKLHAGDLVAGQYEVLGALAHGGLGWIYLARDRAVSDRWVVLKGLLDAASEDAALAAVAEQRFLAALDHPNIVQIYNFVTHDGAGYIVMEYVGGKSLKTLLQERRDANAGRMDPLPVEEAVAYVLGVLPAMGYLHDAGLVYCDMKPDNVVLSGDSLKIIDLGGVRRSDDEDAAIYGTVGYQAAEVAQDGPSPVTDLYTLGRTLAVLCLDFRGYQTGYVDSLPPPDEQPLLARHESLHRFLLKACAADPGDRFGSAEEMADQLLGVLREAAAARGEAHPAVSTVFGPDMLAASGGSHDAEDDWRLLPRPKLDPTDPSAGYLLGLPDEPEVVTATLTRSLADNSLPASTEVLLHLARAQLESGAPLDAHATLDGIGDVRDWRVWWLRGLVALVGGRSGEAVDWLDPVYTDLPGEVAPKLALALAHERGHDLPRSAELYDRAGRTDPSHVSAAFGLARVQLALTEREAAVEALERVPRASSAAVEARVAIVRALVARLGRAVGIGDVPSADQLVRASTVLESLDLDPTRRSLLELEVFESALYSLAVSPAPPAPAPAAGPGAPVPPGGTRLLGWPMASGALRKGMERTYRRLARHATSGRERVRLVDSANRVRPRTFW